MPTAASGRLSSHGLPAPDGQRHFCSACGSPVFSIAAVAPDLVFIKAGSLDDASWLKPAVEVWTTSAQSWSPQFEGTARLERGPR